MGLGSHPKDLDQQESVTTLEWTQEVMRHDVIFHAVLPEILAVHVQSPCRQSFEDTVLTVDVIHLLVIEALEDSPKRWNHSPIPLIS